MKAYRAAGYRPLPRPRLRTKVVHCPDLLIGMATADDRTATAYFLLTAWCTTSCQWLVVPGQFSTVQDAQTAATKRGIYRVVCVCENRRLELEPFAVIGRD
jgi:hypothetical protein